MIIKTKTKKKLLTVQFNNIITIIKINNDINININNNHYCP